METCRIDKELTALMERPIRRHAWHLTAGCSSSPAPAVCLASLRAAMLGPLKESQSVLNTGLLGHQKGAA